MIIIKLLNITAMLSLSPIKGEKQFQVFFIFCLIKH